MNFKQWTLKNWLTALVWAGAFKISSSHIIELAMRFGNRKDDALFYPVIVDAMIIVCALWVASPKGVNKATRLWAAFGRYFGFAATLFANVAHQDLTDAISIGVGLLPAVSVIITTEVFVHGMRSTPAARKAQASRSGKHTGNVVPMRKAS